MSDDRTPPPTEIKSPPSEAQYVPRLGRQTELSPKLIAEVCTYMAAGNPFESACALAKLSVVRAKRWIEYAQNLDLEDKEPQNDQERLMVDFYDGTTRARAEAEARSIQAIRRASTTDWRAAAHSLTITQSDLQVRTTFRNSELQSIFDDLEATDVD